MPGVAEQDKKSSSKAMALDSPEKRKKEKKRKENDTASEPSKKKSSKKQKLEDGSAAQADGGSSSEDPYALDNFQISEVVKEKLREKGIQALFPIQAQTFDAVRNGDDLVGRARTGQGKTLAFVLPILESLAQSSTGHKQHGRAPTVLVLAPTRELAKQVHSDFEFYGASLGLKTVCVYGGSQMGPQEHALRKGVDVVVGTPGRVKDFFERGTLNVKTLKFRVLDEADEMLNMGFVEDVELILGGVEDTSAVQTLLFSATMPKWVQEIAKKFLKADKKTVDLVGDSKMKASTSVRHLLLQCAYTARPQLVSDVIKVYGRGGRVIVFTETKNDASELAGALGATTSRALHGDIPQSQREHTLAGFRTGKFNVLVATDVAARGLDINDVELVIQCEPPRDVETYIHRSGRTGRAGNTGTAVLLYDRKKEWMVPEIEKKAGVKFERISAPQPAAIAKETASVAAKDIAEVSEKVVPLFREAAQELVDSSGLTAVDMLAKALAKLSGYTTFKTRSLYTSHDDSTTLIFKANRQMYSAGYVFNTLRGFLSEELISEVRRMNLTTDQTAAVFDVPSTRVESFLSGNDDQNFSIVIAESMPELQAKPERSTGNNRNGGGFGGRGGGGLGGRGGGGRGGGRTSNRGGFRGGRRGRG